MASLKEQPRFFVALFVEVMEQLAIGVAGELGRQLVNAVEVPHQIRFWFLVDRGHGDFEIPQRLQKIGSCRHAASVPVQFGQTKLGVGLLRPLWYSTRVKRFLFAIVMGLLLSLSLLVETKAATPGESSVFTFKTPRPVDYELMRLAKPLMDLHWLPAHERNRPSVRVEFGSQVILRLAKGYALGQATAGLGLELEQEFAPQLFVLRARSVRDALASAEALGQRDGVLISHPVRRRPMQKMTRLAKRPNDPMFPRQWTLENRDAKTGVILGPEFNIREAWSLTAGVGVVIGFVDDGIDLTHTEFKGQGAEELHYNFTTEQAKGEPTSTRQGHGTVVTGLAVAKYNNAKGLAGISPEAKFASEVVWDAGDNFGTELQVANMFKHRVNAIHVQNHSWGSSTIEQLDVPEIESVAIREAIENGRDGKGVVMVRVSGNMRSSDWSAHDDGYSNDPRVVTVGAVDATGRVSGFSNAGACVLCAGLIGEVAGDNPVHSTDRMGSLGWNRKSSLDDPEVGSYHAIERGGTSFTAPQISGVVALILSANPGLTYRDVQQVLVHASRHFDFEDPFLATNAAGYWFSNNTGFGVPDTGAAVRLAKRWTNAEPLVEKTYEEVSLNPVPDDGLLVQTVLGGAVNTFRASPGNGLVPDDPIEALPLIDVGKALEPIETDLSGAGAFIQRGGAFFSEKVHHAAAAGAEFAVIHNHNGGDERFIMGDMGFVPIPAVFISQKDGESIRTIMASTAEERVRVKLALEQTGAVINVPDSLLSEQIGVRVDMKHPIRGDIRLTVKSPSGTRSVLQANVPDGSEWRSDWVFWSNQFFYEPAKGDWTVAVTDLAKSFTGVLSSIELVVRGTAMTDTDNDGLADDWEQSHFGSLEEKSLGDPDRDGWPNSREQAMHSNPVVFDRSFDLRLHPLAAGRLRLSWPAWRGFQFQVQSAADAGGPWSDRALVESGRYESEWIFELQEDGVQFFQVKAQLKP